MNYYRAKDLAESFRTVRKNTILIAEEIPEEKYGFRAAPDTRSVAETLVHIAVAPSFQHQIHAVERRTTLEGFDFVSLVQHALADEQKPRSKAQILEMLRQGEEQWANWLSGLTDEVLAERVNMRPGMTPASKSRFEMILGVKEHEMHHRAQLMMIERVLGMVPHMTREMQTRMAQASGAAKA